MSSSLDRLPRALGNWWLGDCLGAGYSGAIYKSTHLHTHQVVALKVQDVDHECPTNRYERHIYPALAGGEGMPILYESGVYKDWDFLAMELLGASLDSLYRKAGQQVMDLKSVCAIAIQVISRLQTMHNRGVLHRDIQLGNCVIGVPPNEKMIYMIDFGFSKIYIDPKTRRHIPDSKAKRDFIGNYWFSSVRVHCNGTVPSRRDDLEAAALMFIHLLTPRGLSWTRNGVPKTDEAHDRLKEEKRKARPEQLCRGLPVEFEEFLRYCRSLKFKDQPDYDKWMDEFRSLAESQGFTNVDEFVWPPLAKPASAPRVVKQKSKPAAERRAGAPPPDDLDKIIRDLQNIRLEKDVLGDRQHIQQIIAENKKEVHVSKESDNYYVISSGSEGDQTKQDIPPPFLMPKKQQLIHLSQQVLLAINNKSLAQHVDDFVHVLKSNSSRTLTKDGFAFLDALHKQLADPSVFMAPLRTSRSSDVALKPDNKLGTLARLRRDVLSARTNKTLARLVEEFGGVTDASPGRTITKDGFHFLTGLAANLRESEH